MASGAQECLVGVAHNQGASKLTAAVLHFLRVAYANRVMTPWWICKTQPLFSIVVYIGQSDINDNGEQSG